MSHTFASDWQAWRAVLGRQKGTIGVLFLLLSLLIVMFLQVFWGYQWYQQQLSYLSAQVEIIAEIRPEVDPIVHSELQAGLQELPQVQEVQYWPVEKSLAFIDQQILPGYSQVFQDEGVNSPVPALFRIKLLQLEDRPYVEQLIQDRFGQQLSLMESPIATGQGSVAFHFLSSLRSWSQLFYGFLMLMVAFFLLFSGYIASVLVRERMDEFHLTEYLGFVPPFPFFSGFLFVSFILLIAMLIGLLVSWVTIGQLLWTLALVMYALMESVALGVMIMHRRVGRG